MCRPWRVLLVDDNDDFREMCAEYLTTAAYEVVQARNGVEALDKARRLRPDVIVMDLEMPVMGGLEAIELLGADARTRAIPVVVLSANGVVEHAEASRMGCNTSLGKPCDPYDLEGIVRTMVDTKRLESASRG